MEVICHQIDKTYKIPVRRLDMSTHQCVIFFFLLFYFSFLKNIFYIVEQYGHQTCEVT